MSPRSSIRIRCSERPAGWDLEVTVPQRNRCGAVGSRPQLAAQTPRARQRDCSDEAQMATPIAITVMAVIQRPGPYWLRIRSCSRSAADLPAQRLRSACLLMILSVVLFLGEHGSCSRSKHVISVPRTGLLGDAFQLQSLQRVPWLADERTIRVFHPKSLPDTPNSCRRGSVGIRCRLTSRVGSHLLRAVLSDAMLRSRGLCCVEVAHRAFQLRPLRNSRTA